MSRLRGRFGLLAVLAVLVFMSLVAPASTQSPTLTPDLLNNLLGLVARKSEHLEIPANAANSLGLTAIGQSWMSNSIAIPDARPGFHHAFSVSAGSDQDIVFTFRIPDSMYLYSAQRSGKIVSAEIYAVKTGQITMIALMEAQKGLDAEIAFWAAKFQETK
jgi:hypothetical protein